ncbi:MAG: TonB-dependent receptor [Chitinophagaceae bacterium]
MVQTERKEFGFIQVNKSLVRSLIVSPKHYEGMYFNAYCKSCYVNQRLKKHTLRIMQLTAIILLIACLQLSARGTAQTITMSEKNASLENVIKEIRKQSGYDCWYENRLLVKAEKVDINVSRASLEDALDVCFKGKSLTWSIIGKIIVIRPSGEPAKPVSPPVDIVVSGTVIDSADSKPLEGVSIMVQSSGEGTQTNSSGKYSIKVPANSVLSFAYVGYVQKFVRVGEQTTINVRLAPSDTKLDQVVVIGYGTQRTANITGAVSTISTADLKNPPVATIGQMLQGRIPGVRITQNTGKPGEGPKFQIRGAVSLTATSDPLYVVDGMPIVGDISFINPGEIENISVLKDPAAASLYGSRASNGVIMITTKSGKAGEVRVDFNTYYGVESVPQNRRLKMMNATEYAQFQKEIAELNGRPVNPVFQNPSQYGKGTDWFDVLTRQGTVQSHSLTASGGTDKFKAAATVGYFNETGVLINTGFKRYSLRLNTRYTPSDKVTIGFNIVPTYTYNTNLSTDGGPYSTGNILSSALITTPLANPYNADGTLALTASDPATFGNPNWLRVIKEKVYQDRNLQLLSNAFMEVRVARDFTLRSSLNVQTGNRGIFQFNPTTIGTLFSPPPRIASGSDNDMQFTNWVNENTINYQKTIGEHNLEVLAGFTSQKYRLDGNLVTATNYPDDRIQAVSAAATTLVTTNVQEWSLLSYLARLNYQFKGKYLLSGSIRRDGSSRFGPNNRWGNFPAVSAGWIVSRENFWKSKSVSFFKLRASYGITGNFDIGNYTHVSSINNVFYPFANTPVTGRAPNNLGDQNLGWENNKQLNIGADISFLNERVQFTYNYYVKNTSDLLFNVNVPVSSGFSNLQSNIGELKFWGHEFSVNAAIIKNKSVTWNSNFNISFDRNKTIALTTASGTLYTGVLLYQFRSHITEVGKPIAQFYGAVFDGVYVNKADFDKSPKYESSAVGTAKFKDLNGDGKITFPEDMKAIGNPWPKFTYGFTNDFTYKNFELSVSIAGSYGNKVLPYHENWTTNLDGVFNVLEEVSHRWKSEADPGDGKYGSALQGTTALERDRWHTRYLKDGSYLSIKNIRLAYDLPVRRYLGISGAQVYASVQNAFVFTKYPGPNPEVNTRERDAGSFGITPGLDENSYPVPRTFSLGLNVNFSKK